MYECMMLIYKKIYVIYPETGFSKRLTHIVPMHFSVVLPPGGGMPKK